MKTMRMAARVATVAVAVFAALVGPVAPAQADVGHSFRAVSGDSCQYGVAIGYVTWRSGSTPGVVAGLDVRGSLADHPTANDPHFPCRDDGFSSVVVFTAYLADGTGARRALPADNEVVTYSFSVGSNTHPVRIVRLTIQVCRHAGTTTPGLPSYCGPLQSYPAPL